MPCSTEQDIDSVFQHAQQVVSAQLAVILQVTNHWFDLFRCRSSIFIFGVSPRLRPEINTNLLLRLHRKSPEIEG